MLKWYISKPHFIFSILIAFTFMGIIGFFSMPRDLFPPADRPQIAVVVQEPGATAKYIADHTASVIERQLYTISGIRRVYSTSNDGFCTVTAEFHYSKPLAEAKTDVANALSKVQNLLPKDILPPQIYEITSYTPPVMVLTVSPKKDSHLSLEDVRYIAENQIKNEILRTNAVANVDVFGGYTKEVHIQIDNAKLSSYGLSPQDVINAIQKSNNDTPLGIMINKDTQNTFILKTEAKSLDELKNIQITKDVKLSDVAKVEFGIKPPTAMYQGNGKEGIALAIQRPYGGAVLSTISAVEEVLPKIKAQFPQLNIDISDTQKELVKLSNENMLEALRDAIIFTSLVIFLFLANLRMTIIAGLSIPFVYLATIAFMWLFGIGFNTVSLTGVILALGMLVDDAIVILENIERHLFELKKSPVEAAIDGTKEVMLVVFGGTVATAAVIFPMLFVGDFPEKIFRPLAGTLLIAIFVSYVVSITLIPILAIKFLKNADKKSVWELKINQLMLAWLNPLKNIYIDWIKTLIHKKKIRPLAVMPLVMLFVISLKLIPFTGRDLMPPMDTGIVKANVAFNSNTSIWQVNQEVKKIQDYIYSLGNVKRVSVAIGTEPGVLTISGGTPQTASFTITFVNRFERKETIWQLEDKIRDYIHTLPNIKYADVYDYGATALSSIKANLDTTLYSDNLEALNKTGNAILEIANNTPGLKSASKSWDMDKIEYEFKIDKQKTALYNTTPYDVAVQVSAGLQGQISSVLTIPNETGFLIRVILSPEQRSYIDQFKSYLIKTPKGFVPLEALGEFTQKAEPTIITRQALDYTQDIYGYRGTNAISHIMENFQKEFEKYAKNHPGFPLPNIKIEQTGDIQQMMDSMGRMFKAILIGLVILYLVLAAVFKSWKDPVAIMLAIPLSIIGGSWSLLIADKHMCLPAIMGFILLAGIIVKNSILIIEFIKTYREKGYSKEEAILESVNIRTRPVMMTAFGTAVGMIPIALEWAIGLERLSPLAVVAIGGLIVGTFLSLVYVPFFYYLIDRGEKNEKTANT
jgi:multidrug efflux pump subunit AcrB